MKKNLLKPILKLILLIVIIVSVCVGAYFILKAFGLNDIEKLREIVNGNKWGTVIYILLQAFQVVFIPLSTALFTVPAIILFGPTKAFLISWVGIVLGSIIMFFIGRGCGDKVLGWIVGKDKIEKYVKLLGKGNLLLPILLLIPIFPDDIICASAGVAKTNNLYFIITIIITRCIDTACTCFIGGSLLQTPWGIALLAIFTIAMAILSVFLVKKQEKIENWIVKTFTKKNKE